MSGFLRIAIADDEREMRDTLQRMLHDLGHQVVSVADHGKVLINQCAATHPDVVITSTLTPDLTGCDAAAAIYQQRPIPIILYSGHCEPDRVVNAEHKHVFLYLVKPICQEHLQAALKECLFVDRDDSHETDDRLIPVEVSSSSHGGASCREPTRPPYRNLPR